MCQYIESLKYKRIIETTVYNCRIKGNDQKRLGSMVISYYLSLRFSCDKVQKHKEIIDERI